MIRIIQSMMGQREELRKANIILKDRIKVLEMRVAATGDDENDFSRKATMALYEERQQLKNVNEELKDRIKLLAGIRVVCRVGTPDSVSLTTGAKETEDREQRLEKLVKLVARNSTANAAPSSESKPVFLPCLTLMSSRGRRRRG
mmetsp:Transcript_16164/g.38761  ORF Transcript_16164/g.38761 Transcript_16164/m.38761 type:complete len:145 (+) Transcript_16164:125-559(+)